MDSYRSNEGSSTEAFPQVAGTTGYHQAVSAPTPRLQQFGLDVANQCLWTPPSVGPARCIALTSGVLRLLERLLQSDDDLGEEESAISRAQAPKRPVPGVLCPSATYTPGGHLQDPLTARELKILRFLPTNMSAKDIADELHVSVHTVRTHMSHIYAKLGVHRRSQASRKAKELGLMSPLPLSRTCECGRLI